MASPQVELPSRVAAAMTSARQAGFTALCLPQHGRLLQLLAGGVGAGTIGETGTGHGVGLAWMASAADSDARLFSVERDLHWSEQARATFAVDPRVHVRHADWRDLRTREIA